MLEKVNLHSSVAVVQQIETQIQSALAAGKLEPGDKLPSVRELSERLSVSPNTIAKAYKNLDIMGLVSSRHGIGIFVRKGNRAELLSELRARLNS